MEGPDLRSFLRRVVWELRPGEQALAERLAEEHGLPRGPVEKLVAELRLMPRVTVVPAPEEFAVAAGATSAKDARRMLEAIRAVLHELDSMRARVGKAADSYIDAIRDDTARTMLDAVDHRLNRYGDYQRALRSVADAIEAQGEVLAELRESFERVHSKVRALPGKGELYPWLRIVVEECRTFWQAHKDEPTMFAYLQKDGDIRRSAFARFVHGIVRGVEGAPGLFPWITAAHCDEVLRPKRKRTGRKRPKPKKAARRG